MASIESAATLTNAVHSLVTQSQLQPWNVIQRTLASFQESRKIRASATINSSNESTRIRALRGVKEYIIALSGVPHGG